MIFKINTFLHTVFIVLFVLLSSCKSTKKLKENNANLGLSTKELIEENIKLTPDFRTLESKLKIAYSKEETKQNYTLSFRMKKDEVIWINAPFSIVRAKITPEKVAFYNKLDNTYFEGDYKYLNDLFGVELDFIKFQNLLLGEAIFDLNDENYKLSMHENEYLLQPKKQPELFEFFFILKPSNYKISSQQLSQTKELKHLQIDYKLYQEVENQKIPELIHVIVVEANKQVSIDLEFNSVSLNTELRFPFSIPSGYDKIELK